MTSCYRKYKKINILPYFFSGNIKRLNRLLLEQTYSDAPKSSNKISPNYVVSNFKWHKGEYNIKDEFYCLKNDCSEFLAVYKIK